VQDIVIYMDMVFIEGLIYCLGLRDQARTR